jgi:hypothetical protein
MLPTEKVQVTRYTVNTSAGRAHTGLKKEGKTLTILAGGYKYQVPDYAANGLLDQIKTNEERALKQPLHVWRDSDQKFRWEFQAISEEPEYLDNTQINKAAGIQHGECFEILEFGEKPHARGASQLFVRLAMRQGEDNKRFFLPRTIKDLMLEHVKNGIVKLPRLKGWSLFRPSAGLVKTVPRSNNDEPPIILYDREGTKIQNIRWDGDPTELLPKSKRALDSPVEQGSAKRARKLGPA